MKSNPKIIVVGGGAAGMIAAWKAASFGAKVLLLEKNARLGIKIRISGGGKCNITHGGDMETLRNQFQKEEARFLKFAFRTFKNIDLLDLLKEYGVETYERDNGKIFPTSNNADDIVDAFKKLMIRVGIEIHPHSPVQEILKNDDGSFSVKIFKETFTSECVIVAVGGSSYAKTGTTGDGYGWAKHFGHTIISLRPALSPIYLDPSPPLEWQGVPIRDCTLIAKSNNKIVAQWQGDVLFTHLGISGPATLEVSNKAFLELEKKNTVHVCVDFFPELSKEELEQNILKEIALNGTRHSLTLIEQFVPQRLALSLLQQSKIESTKKLHHLKKEERLALIQTLKEWEFGRVKEIPLDRGEVTAGGVALNEVDQTTMQSKIVNGLFFCGEILDIAGPVGGYNLQAAFSTGYVAGEAAYKYKR